MTRQDAYPIPPIDDSLDALASSQFLRTVDLTNGYWQVLLADTDKVRLHLLHIVDCGNGRCCHSD